jgi:hypothetical protein
MEKIPGPWKKAWPVVGNLLECLRPDFHKVLLKWADDYGVWQSLGGERPRPHGVVRRWAAGVLPRAACSAGGQPGGSSCAAGAAAAASARARARPRRRHPGGSRVALPLTTAPRRAVAPPVRPRGPGSPYARACAFVCSACGRASCLGRAGLPSPPPASPHGAPPH